MSREKICNKAFQVMKKNTTYMKPYSYKDRKQRHTTSEKKQKKFTRALSHFINKTYAIKTLTVKMKLGIQPIKGRQTKLLKYVYYVILHVNHVRASTYNLRIKLRPIEDEYYIQQWA